MGHYLPSLCERTHVRHSRAPFDPNYCRTPKLSGRAEARRDFDFLRPPWNQGRTCPARHGGWFGAMFRDCFIPSASSVV